MRSLKVQGVVPSLLAALTLACGGSNEPPGQAATIEILAGNNQVVSPGTTVATQPSVRVSDANANWMGGVQVIFTVTSGGGSVTGGSQTTNVSGVATVGSWTVGSADGVNTLTASAAGLSPVTFTAMVGAGKPPWDY
jgi:hypothetical protein